MAYRPEGRLYPPASPEGEVDGGQASRRPPGERNLRGEIQVYQGG